MARIVSDFNQWFKEQWIDIIRTQLNNPVFFKGAQAGGRTWDLFGFSFIFSLKSSALDHSATAPPGITLFSSK